MSKTFFTPQGKFKIDISVHDYPVDHPILTSNTDNYIRNTDESNFVNWSQKFNKSDFFLAFKYDKKLPALQFIKIIPGLSTQNEIQYFLKQVLISESAEIEGDNTRESLLRSAEDVSENGNNVFNGQYYTIINDVLVPVQNNDNVRDSFNRFIHLAAYNENQNWTSYDPTRHVKNMLLPLEIFLQFASEPEQFMHIKFYCYTLNNPNTTVFQSVYFYNSNLVVSYDKSMGKEYNILSKDDKALFDVQTIIARDYAILCPTKCSKFSAQISAPDINGIRTIKID